MNAVCQNNTCECPVETGTAYCSDRCHAAASSNPQTADCGCGHADCRAEREVAAGSHSRR
jgi:hypothetical protein